MKNIKKAGLVKSLVLRDKILELRTSGKDNQIRILYFFF